MRCFKMKKLLITSLFFVFLSASALGQPTGPHILDGEVTLNNETVAGTVEARYNGQVLSSIEAENGEFSDLAVQNVEAGTEVDVYISGVEADQNVTYEPWKVEERNFSASFEKEENVTVTNVKENVSKDEGLDIEVPEQASKESSGVDGLNISVNEDVNDVEVNITVSDETNDEVNKEEIQEVEDSGSTFLGVIDVDTNILEAARGSATIGFKVNKSRIGEPREVVLIHYENGSRVGVLESTYRAKKTQTQNDDFYYLSADTSSFSSFAITSDTTDPDADVGDDVTVDAEEDVEFNASDSTDNVEIKNYTWEFSDQTLEGKTVENSFDDSGTYDVELTVYDTSGNSDMDTKTVTVESTANIEDLESASDTQADEDTDEDSSQDDSTDSDSQDLDEDQAQQDDSNTSEVFTEASIGVSSMNVTPQSGNPPFDVEVQVEVENTGNTSGSEEIEVFAGNESIGSQNVELGSGAWTALTFDYTVEEEGDVEFSAGDQSVTVDSKAKSFPWIGVLALLSAIVGAGYLRREELNERLEAFRESESDDSSSSSDSGEADLEYTCDECGASFDSERGLHIHQGEVHDEDEDE